MSLSFHPAISNRQATAEPNLIEYVRVLWRHKLLIVLTILVTTGAVVGIDRERTRIYQGTAQLLFTAQGTSSGSSAGSVNVATDIELVPSAPVQAVVARMLHAAAPPVSVTEVGTTNVAQITVHSTSPSFAAAAANAYVGAYIQVSTQEFVASQLNTERQIQKQITPLQNQITTITNELNGATQSNGTTTSPQSAGGATSSELNAELPGLYDQLGSLQQQLSQVQLATAQGGGAGRLVTPAVPDPIPISPKQVKDAVIAAALGLLVGLGFALLHDRLDDRIRGVEDLEEAGSGLPAIGLVPALSEWRNRKSAFLVTAERPHSAAAEAYRALRTSVQFMAVDRPVNILQITSPAAVEGKTTTAVNLAFAMGEAGQRVIIVDCDLRRPRVHEFFDLSNEVGLTSVLLGETPIEKALFRVRGNLGLRVLPAGPIPPNPSELLSGESAARLFRTLADAADFVVLDSAPVLPVTDAVRRLAARVDAVLIVTAAGISTARALTRTLELLSRVDARVVGTVLNRAPQIGTYAPYAYTPYGYTYDARNGNGKVGARNGNGKVGARNGSGKVDEILPAHTRQDDR